MIEKQLTFEDDEIVQILNKVYQSFKEGSFQAAVPLLEKAISLDFEYPGIAAALKSASFWKERQATLRDLAGDEEIGDYLFAQWKQFMGFLEGLNDINERCVYTLRYSVFSTALAGYLRLYEESSRTDAQILLKIGRCYKNVGNFESAIEYLELANQQRRDNPVVIAELADCYSLINENRAAKVFFREAFYLGAGEVDLQLLESPMLQKLVGRLRQIRIEEADLPEWIPVYATIYGVFNVKRELRPLEFGRLKQAIYSLEKELEVTGTEGDTKARVPRLINRYFWLIDHLVSAHEDKSKVDEVLRKIRDISPAIYEEYMT